MKSLKRSYKLTKDSCYYIPPEKLEVVKAIGRGNFYVHEGKFTDEKGEKVDVAIKVFDYDSSERKKEDLDRETYREFLIMLRSRDHESIIDSKGFSLDVKLREDETPNNVCLVMEKCDDDLESFIRRNPPVKLSPAEKYKMIYDIAGALKVKQHYRRNSVRRVAVRVCDFGISKIKLKSRSTKFVTQGTFMWCAPEFYETQLRTHKADVYSFALVMWSILKWEIPFERKDNIEIKKMVLEAERPNIGDIPKQYLYLLNRCWAQNPNDRPTYDEIIAELNHIESVYRYRNHLLEELERFNTRYFGISIVKY